MLPIVACPRPAGLHAHAGRSLHTLRMDRNAYRDENDTGQPDAYEPDAYQAGTYQPDRTISLPGCVTVASSARPGPYQVQVRDASVASPVRTFKLAR